MQTTEAADAPTPTDAAHDAALLRALADMIDRIAVRRPGVEVYASTGVGGGNLRFGSAGAAGDRGALDAVGVCAEVFDGARFRASSAVASSGREYTVVSATVAWHGHRIFVYADVFGADVRDEAHRLYGLNRRAARRTGPHGRPPA